MRNFLPFHLCVAFAALLLASPAFAQAGSWASDQAAGDAALHGGQYEQAVAAYARAIATAESGTMDAATKAAVSKMLVNEGNCLLKLKRTPEAMAAYEQAAPLSPNPSTAYFNLCAVHYNIGDTAGALVACNKEIEVDPGKADAYFIKGSVLLAGATMVNGKMQAPPGTLEALHKYLELAPNGAHAADTQQMIDYLK
jgi:tetratricopeptide (TPR) repeat protein